MTPDADAKMTQETAFHPSTSKLTRNFVEYNGYWLPTCYINGGAEDEYFACREKAVVMAARTRRALVRPPGDRRRRGRVARGQADLRRVRAAGGEPRGGAACERARGSIRTGATHSSSGINRASSNRTAGITPRA